VKASFTRLTHKTKRSALRTTPPIFKIRKDLYKEQFGHLMLSSHHRTLTHIAACMTEAMRVERYHCNDCNEALWIHTAGSTTKPCASLFDKPRRPQRQFLGVPRNSQSSRILGLFNEVKIQASVSCLKLPVNTSLFAITADVHAAVLSRSFLIRLGIRIPDKH